MKSDGKDKFNVLDKEGLKSPPHRCLIFRRNPVLPRLRQRSQFSFSRLQIGCHGIGRRPQNLKHSSWDKQQMYKWQKHSIWIGQCCKQKKMCKKSNRNQGKICQAVCVCVTSSKVISFFLGGLTFGAPVMHIWCILSMDSLRGQKSFSAPSCDVWPKMSENLLWIFPGSNWLNPEGQRCQSHSWRVSMKCPDIAEIFSHFSTYSDYFLTFPDVNPPSLQPK